MSEYVRSSKGVGCLGCQPSGFGLFGRPTIGSMGTDWVLDWESGEEAQPVVEPAPQAGVLMADPRFRGIVSTLKRVGDAPYTYPGSAAPPQGGGATRQQTSSEAAALRQSQTNVNLEEGGAPNWVGPVIMGVIGLGMVGGVIWGLKKLDVI